MATSKQNQASKSKQDGLLSDRKAAAHLEGLVSLLLGLEFTNQQSSLAKESSDQYSAGSQAGRSSYEGMLKSDRDRPGTEKGVGTGVPWERYWHVPGQSRGNEGGDAAGSYATGRSEKIWQLGTEDGAVGLRSYVGDETKAPNQGERQPDRQRSTATPDNSVHQAVSAATGSSYSQQPGDNEIGKALEALSSLLLGTTQTPPAAPAGRKKWQSVIGIIILRRITGDAGGIRRCINPTSP